jgi:hypothetical protein
MVVRLSHGCSLLYSGVHVWLVRTGKAAWVWAWDVN